MDLQYAQQHGCARFWNHPCKTLLALANIYMFIYKYTTIYMWLGVIEKRIYFKLKPSPQFGVHTLFI